MGEFLDLGLMDEPAGSDELVDGADEFTEAERRLSLARYYQQLTRGGLFGDDESEEASVVDQEVRQFARTRMNVLIGLQAAEEMPPPASPFTEAQLSALRQWADHMIQRSAQPAQPTIRPMAPPPAAKKPPERMVQATEPAPKRKTKLVGKKPEPMKKGEPPRAGALDLGAPMKAEPAPSVDYDAIPDGQVFEENGKKYKFIQTDRPGDDGKPKRVKLDVTEQARSPLSIAMPRREHMPYVTERQAAESLDASIGGSTVAMAAAASSLNRNEYGARRYMSDKFSSKNSIRGQGRTLATKTDRLEQQLATFVAGADRLLTELNKRLTALEETVLAVVQTIGMEEIQGAIVEQRKINGEKRVVDEAAALEEALKDGYVLPADTVEEMSFIVGVENDKDGNLLGYGPQQSPFPQLPEEFKPLLLGKKVGDAVETPTKGKFELTGIYRIDEEKRLAVMKEKEDKARADAEATNGARPELEESADVKEPMTAGETA